MSYPTLEQVRTQSNPIQPAVVPNYWVIVHPTTYETSAYRLITSTWSDAQCDGFMFIKEGTTYYERVITTPYVNAQWFGAIGNGASNPVSAQIDPSTGVPFANFAAVQVYYPTAVTISDEVVGLAIQNAINFAIYEQQPGGTKEVWLPSGTYLTSDTIHMGYGETYSSVVLTGGLTYPYGANNANQKGATIEPQFSDRPAINLQGQRESMIQGISIVGKNVANPGYNNMTWNNAALYLSSGLGTNADSRYAPYAGITIDAFGGNAPSPAYPTVNYPIAANAYGINITTQYNKNCSSKIHINHCQIENFVVGIVQQPSGVEANGDFIKTTFTSVQLCKYGISAGGGQGRLAEITDCNLDTCYTLVTNAIHGAQHGRINLIQNTHFSGYQMLNFVETAWNGQLVLRDCYAESIFTMGYFGANRTSPGNLTIDNCLFKFDHSTGVPASLIETDSAAKITFKGGGLSTGTALLTSVAGIIELDGVSVQASISASVSTYLTTNSNAIWSNFLTFTCGLPAYSAFSPGKNMKDCLLAASGLATALYAIGVGNAVGYEGSKNFNTDPSHAIGGANAYTGHLGSTYRYATSPGLSTTPPASTFSNRILTLPYADFSSVRLVSVSDYLIDKGNQTLWLVISMNGTNVVLLLINAFQVVSSGPPATFTYSTYFGALSLTTAPISSSANTVIIHTGFNRNYALANNGYGGELALIGDVVSGSPTVITNMISANTTGSALASQFAVIDSTKFVYLYFIAGTDPTVRSSSWQGPFRVSSINNTTTPYSMTLDQSIVGTGKVYVFNASIYQ